MWTLALTLPQVPGFICIAISTGWVRLVYCDTDTVIYIQHKGEPNLIESRNKLGDKTSELRSLDYVYEFVSGAYMVIDTVTVLAATVCKVRGITLYYSAKQFVKFEVTRLWFLGRVNLQSLYIRKED